MPVSFVTLFCIVFLYPQIALESIVEAANVETLYIYVAEIATYLK